MRTALLALTVALPSLTHAQDIPPCDTNLGPCLAFTGYQAVITAPVDFATMTHDTRGLFLYPDIRSGTSALVIVAPTTETFEAQITFLTMTNDPVHTCQLTATPFADQIDLATTGFGTCDFTVVDGTPEVVAGRGSQTVETPSELREISAFPAAILGASPVSVRQIEIVGIAPGVGHIAWLGEDMGDGMLRGVCPFTVVPAP